MIPHPSTRSPRRAPSPALPGALQKKQSAFTLIETALALGIAAFALVPLMGLVPLGLQTSRNAADLTVTSQIAQRMAGMIQQADADNYSSLTNVYFYFDGDGQPLTGANAPGAASSVYTASIQPGPAAASPSSADPFIIPLIVQVVNDPGHRLSGTPSLTLSADLQARATTTSIYRAKAY